MFRNHWTKIIVSILLIISFVALSIYAIRIFPKDGGSYCINDYARQIEIGFKPDQKYHEIKNYWSAYKIAQEVILNRFPESELTLFTPYYKRTVYFDSQSSTWFVYVSPYDPWTFGDDVWILGGEYGCILSSDGTVISCWGWG